MAKTIEQILREQLGELMFSNAVLASQLESMRDELSAAQKALEELKKK